MGATLLKPFDFYIREMESRYKTWTDANQAIPKRASRLWRIALIMLEASKVISRSIHCNHHIAGFNDCIGNFPLS